MTSAIVGLQSFEDGNSLSFNQTLVAEWWHLRLEVLAKSVWSNVLGKTQSIDDNQQLHRRKAEFVEELGTL